MLTRVLRRPLLLAVATATTIAAAVVPITPAFAADPTKGSLVGHLTDSHGAAVAGARVTAQVDGWPFGTATTDGAGAYSFADVPPGQYQVGFTVTAASGQASYTQWAHQQTEWWNAPAFTVDAGATVAVDERLLPTGTVSGRLLNPDGTPASVAVTFYDAATQNTAATASSAADGRFEVLVPAGGYKVSYVVNGQSTQWSGGKRTFATADTVTVADGQAVTVEEHALPAGSIGGRLTASDGTPVAGSWVTVTDELGNATNGTTDADGRYRVDGLPAAGRFTVGFGAAHAVTVWAHGSLTEVGAQRFAVAEGQTTTVDESLPPTGAVRVVAHDATTGAPIARFCLWTVATSTYQGCTESGEILIDEVYAGAWHLNVSLDDGVHLDRVAGAVVIGGQTTQVDVALTAGATITTTLTERATGGPAQGCVQPVDVDAALVDTGFRQWCTEEGGNTLRIGPLAPGTYQLIADPGLDTLGLQWVGATGGTGSREAAQRITVASGAVAAGPAVLFDRAGTIRGRYTDAVTGAPVGGACVSVITPTRNAVGGDGCGRATQPDGTYTLTGIGPYTWAVGFAKSSYQWRWTGNAVNRHEASTVTVVAGGKVTANLKARAGGGTVVGTIRDSTGAPVLAYLRVVDALTGEPVAYAADTRMDATYTIANVPPQQVKVYYVVSDGRAGWLGGTSLASARTHKIKNGVPTAITVTIPVA
ncbi:carboxypeptidase regulatory-like domain-containing protein [Dactylosporangium cerinum]|uniref:alpha-amylase n=1 Tax=Dactylosporangium cerinum TaxID=1434730 RepID=A0ABV9W113_9ACTN